jgi:hypothetical protein
MALETEQKTYERRKEELLANAGKFALIKGEEIAGALRVGYEKFKLDPFMVKKIEAIETAHCFTRNIAPCHT